MNILALETSTEACSVALLTEKGEIYSEFDLTPRLHTRFLPIMMDAVLQQSSLQKSQLTHVAYSNGPGAFTGIRIAASTAQGIGLGLGIPLVPISTLAILAQQALDEHGGEYVRVALDARMGETYTADYQKYADTGLVECVEQEQLVKLDQLAACSNGLSAGSGFKARREALGMVSEQKVHICEDTFPTAQALVKLAQDNISKGQIVTAEQVSINYIRNNVAVKKKPLNA